MKLKNKILILLTLISFYSESSFVIKQGNGAEASEDSSIAIGYQAKANARWSIAIGNKSETTTGKYYSISLENGS